MEERPVKVCRVGVRVTLGSGLDTGVEAHEEAKEVRDYSVRKRGKVVVAAGWGITFRAGSFAFLGFFARDVLCVWDVVISAFSLR